MILAGDYIPQACQVELGPLEGYRILANLEGALLRETIPSSVLKAGSSLFSSSLGCRHKDFIFSLANNHMMDYGPVGLAATRQYLAQMGIPLCGAGENVADARKPVFVEEVGKTIAIIGCREVQFGSAGRQKAGCADIGLWLLDSVSAAKAAADYVVVSCHAAFEHSPFPSPGLRSFYHRLIDSGADVVHGHHAHVPQGWEEYHGGLILYGLGNFVVDPVAWSSKNARWSLYASVDFGKPKMEYHLHTVSIEATAPGLIRLTQADQETRQQQLDYLDICNRALVNDEACESYWQEVCLRLFDRFYGMPLHIPGMSEHCLTFRERVRYIADGLADLYAALTGAKIVSDSTRRRACAYCNSFQCESHRDVISTVCGVLLGERRDIRTADTARDVAALLER